MATKRGIIKLVGAGPGDPDLLTVAALKALQEADVVIADQLISSDILKLVKGELKIAPKKRRVKKSDGSLEPEPKFAQSKKNMHLADKSQSTLDDWVLEALNEDKYVVRLKNGDPFIFGRGGEEIEVYKQAGFQTSVIPGISSCLSAPLAGGYSPTMRDVADQLLICSGFGKHGAIPSIPPYDNKRTTVFLMAVSRLESLVESLVKIGYPSDVPAAIVQEATLPTQKVVQGQLRTLPELKTYYEIKAPAVVIIGNVVTALGSLPSYLPPHSEPSLLETVATKSEAVSRYSIRVNFKNPPLSYFKNFFSGFDKQSVSYSVLFSVVMTVLLFPFSFFLVDSEVVM